MNNPFFSGKISEGQRGIALVSVLVIVVLLTAVMLGFLATSKQEQVSSRSYKASSSARQMADTAVNLVQGQINQATSQGMNYAWASQPGAIRVYDNTGALQQIYRLYSAQSLTTTTSTVSNPATTMNTASTSAGDPAHPDMPPGNWANDTAMWVDLNAPVNDAGGNPRFPIFDETKAANVDGFSVTSAPGATAAQQAPMPVRWLYVLQNGQIIAPDTTSTGTALTFGSAPVAPSVKNPIVGRIAFWTDDETCKVNINTAGGDGVLSGADPTPIANATFWDIPHFQAPDDIQLAQSQPASGEFQRYPGHPATVALHNILNGLGWITLSNTDFYNLLPRYSFGGSKDATVIVDNPPGGPAGPTIPLKGSPNNHLYSSVAEMLFKIDRSPSTDFNNDNTTTQAQIETARFFLTAHSRAPEVTLFGQPRLSIWPELDTVDDTATVMPKRSRTPIDNLLAFCATVPAAGGGIGNPYYFTRYDPTSCSADINIGRNVTLLKYLDYFTASANENALQIPGYGGNFETKYSQLGMRQILMEIFDYIRSINVADSTLAVGNTNTQTYAQSWIPGQNLGLYQVAPSRTLYSPLNATWGDMQGFGIYPRLNEVAIQFVAMGQGASSPTAAVPLNSVYGTSSANSGDSGTDIFGVGDSGAITQQTLNSQTVWAPPPQTRAIQAFLLLSFINPAQMLISNGAGTVGNGAVNPAIWVEVSGLNATVPPFPFTVNGHSLGFPADSFMLFSGMEGYLNGTWDNIVFLNPFFTYRVTAQTPSSSLSWASIYPFYSKIIPIKLTVPSDNTSDTQNQFSFTGGQLTIKLYDGGGLNSTAYSSNANPPTGVGKPPQLIQTYTIKIPDATFPLPAFSPAAPSSGADPYSVPAPLPATGPSVGISTTPNGGDRWSTAPVYWTNDPNWYFILVGDVVQSMVLGDSANSTDLTWTDARMLATANVSSNAFTKNPLWGRAFAYNFWFGEGPYYYSDSSNTLPLGKLNGNTTYLTPIQLTGYQGYASIPDVPPTLAGVPNIDSGVANTDWDNGLGPLSDGPWINKADEGSLTSTVTITGLIPYFSWSNGNAAAVTAAFYSPNREMPSPGMFGSLSTGVDPNGNNPTPWQTLLFRPCPTTKHPGEQSPKDHLLLDLFWMPVAEPYAISEPFSTAGKINLNYQIEPFTYITRSTAIRAVLNPEKIAAVSTAGSNGILYKMYVGQSYQGQKGLATNARAALDITQTLRQFDDKFNGGPLSSTPGTPDIFHSASQICENYLVPQGSALENFKSQWYDGVTYGLVGDNVRERPYANIYGQITTKSNTYTVYYTVQSLKNAEPATDAAQALWDETKGAVLGEYRGSTTLERYIDPNQTLPDFAANPGTVGTVDGDITQNQTSYYKWRVVDNHPFAP